MSPVDLTQIPHEFDSIINLDRAIAGSKQTEMICEDPRLADFPVFYANVRVNPDPSDAMTNRVALVFNDDTLPVYEASHRAHLIVADSPAATESPTIEHVRDAGSLYLTPNLSNFKLAAADVFDCWIQVMQQDAKEKYRFLCWWTLGESTYTGTNKHPRYGFVTGHYCGSVAGKAIAKVTARFGDTGRMAAGSLLSIYGTESALLSPSWIYSEGESWSTSAVWVPTAKPLFRRVLKVTNIPAPGFSNTRAIPDTNLNVLTARLEEAWVVDESLGISEDPGDQLGFKIDATMLQVSSPSGGRDFSGYDYAYVVFHFARP